MNSDKARKSASSDSSTDNLDEQVVSKLDTSSLSDLINDDATAASFTSLAFAANSRTIDELNREISDLKLQLEEEKSNSKQAAEYGLSLLEDFKKLQSKNYELESEVETCKAELEATNQAFAKVKQLKKLEDAKDLNLEQNLLMESADREEKLTKRLTTLEIELNKTKQELQRVYSENEKLVISQQDLNQQYEQLKDTLLKQKSEIKQLKERENRLLVDNTELDGENVQLQQQIIRLKEDLVELDTIKHENKALEEKLETLESQIIELTTLKRIVEKQLEESLLSFREEREHKYQKKRESHERREKQSLQELQIIAKDLNTDAISPVAGGAPNTPWNVNEIDYDDSDEEYNSNVNFNANDNNTQSNNKDSLLAEIESANEIQRLEKKIEEIISHKDQLETELNEFKLDLNQLVTNIQVVNKKIPKQNTSTETESDSDTGAKLNKQALMYFNRLKADLESIIGMVNFDKDTETLKHQLESLKSDSTFVNDNISTMLKFIEQLNQQTCKSMGINQENSEKESEAKKTPVENLYEQIKQLKVNIEKGVDHIKSQQSSESQNPTSPPLPNDVQELQDQIIKLKSLLSTKREQIATLRTVLKANKQTAEVALANLKSKYENEKLVVTETMQKLRNELKTLKEDAATFATLRAMFTARCDEYVAQLDESQRMLVAAEEEKKPSTPYSD